MQQIWLMLDKNIRTCEKTAIERGIFEDICIDTLSFFAQKNHRNENRLLTEIYNKECLYIVSIRTSLGIPRTLFQRYNPGLLHYKISVDIIFLALY